MLNTPEKKSKEWLNKPLTQLIEPNLQNVLLVLLLAAAIFTRLFILGARVMSHDEINHVYFAWQFYAGGDYVHNPITHGPLQFHLLEWSYFLFNVSDFTARIPSAFFSVLTIGFIWQFRRYLGKVGALISALLFTISPYMLYYGRYARNEAIAIFFTLATIWAVLRYLDNGKKKYLYYSAAFAALHFATKETAFIFTAQLLIFLGLLFIYRISKREWVNNQQKVNFLILLGLSLLFLLAMVGAVMLQPEAVGPEVTDAAAAGELAGGEAVIQDGEAGQPLAEDKALDLVSMLPMIFGGLAGFAFLAAFIILMVGFRWENLRNERVFEIMLFQLLLVFPQLAAFPAFWLGLPVSDFYNPDSILKIVVILAIFLVISFVIGALWKWKEWLIGAGIYYGIFTLFYTTIFSNPKGVYTGLIGSLGYWLEQHGVERGSQPDFYFALIQLPMYEYLAVIGVLIISILGIIWLIRRSRQETPAPLTLIENTSDPEEQDQAKLPVFYSKIIAMAMLLFFSVTSVVAYSLVGEKMPWLTVHISWSMWLATGWLLARLVNRIDWKKVFTGRGAAAATWFTLMLISLSSAFGMFFSEKAPFQGQQTDQLTNTNIFLLMVLVGIASGIAMIQTIRSWGKNQVWRFTAMGIVTAMLVLTARTAFTASYVNYDRANEYLVYAHAARGPKDAFEQIEDISVRMTGGTEIKIAYDNHTMYPFWWYLREYPNRLETGENLTVELRDYPLILVGDGNYHKIDPIVRDDYIQFEYVRMVWPNQDYFNLSFYKDYLTNPETRKDMIYALFQVWFNRDFKKYGEVTGQNTSDRYWSPSQTFRLYIRKDVVYQIWEFGSSPGGLELMVDEYAEGYIPLMADKTFGDIGLNAPRGVAAAGDGTVYICDSGNNRILHINQDGIVIGQVGMEGNGPGQFNQPWGIALDQQGNVFVADTWNHRVQKFSPDLEFITSWGSYGQGETGTAFWGPRDIAIDMDGRVLVSDTGNKRVVVFDADGGYQTEFGGGGSLSGQLEEPVGLAVSPVNNAVFVADTWNQRVQVFESSIGVTDYFVSTNQWDIDGWFGQSLENKPYISIDELNNVIVADPENARVLIFSSEGTFIGFFGEYNLQGATGFGLVSGLDADGAGGIWVTDSAKNELKYFTLPR